MVVEVLQPDTEEKDGAADVLQRGGVRAAPAHSQRVVGVPAIDKYRLDDKILETRFGKTCHIRNKYMSVQELRSVSILFRSWR